MLGDLVTMSMKELTRLEIIQRVDSRILKQGKAAKLLGLSTRQIRRLIKEYRKNGASGTRTVSLADCETD